MKEAQTQEEVSTFSVRFVAGNVVPRFPSVKAGCFVGKWTVLQVNQYLAR